MHAMRGVRHEIPNTLERTLDETHSLSDQVQVSPKCAGRVRMTKAYTTSLVQSEVGLKSMSLCQSEMNMADHVRCLERGRIPRYPQAAIERILRMYT